MTVERFDIAVPDEDLAELRERLARTRFADVPALPDWGGGVPGEVLREWVAAWADHDWRAAEADLNRFEHYRATVDGQPIHFIHHPGTGPSPLPLVLLHGWPWTFWDWHATIDALADPGAHGGDPADAFDVVVASVPGATFSTPPCCGQGGSIVMLSSIVRRGRVVWRSFASTSAISRWATMWISSAWLGAPLA